MYTYSFIQWLLFFYIYCFLGWCFESAYVSIKQKHPVNRGFLNGPFLPIYGSGAITVLFAALPFQNSVIAVYFVGMTAATLLELVTGMAMERLFKVRYWDYSYQKFNYKGHICLSSSIAWGFFSIAMIYGFHRPIEKLVFMLPKQLVTYGTFALTIWIAADFATSFKTALELRDVLIAIEKVKHEMELRRKRIEVIEAILADEAAVKKEQFKEELLELRQKELIAKESMRQKLSLGKDKINILRRNPSAHSIAELHVSFEALKIEFSTMKKEMKELIVDRLLERIVEREKETRE